ncbi:hypothetical protein [Streptomyces sp. 35G-GA-8]|nr:hypothetical protein [Streptomyces sp. 35G-GA-8]MCL7376128.1 hypothetical protein [Streptomyces sp. 35G-GA-8]
MRTSCRLSLASTKVSRRDRIHSAHEAWLTGRTAYLIWGERVIAPRS